MKELFIPKTPYKVYTEEGGFSFGIDAVLLSEYGKMKKDKVLCEIGAGTGFISMRAYYLYRLKKVYGVEIQKRNIELFEKSILKNELEDKVVPIFGNIKDIHFGQDSLDYIMTNPPYYKKGSGIQNKNSQELLSRYEIEMTLDDVFSFAKNNLKMGGVLYMIHRPHRLPDLMSIPRKYDMEPKEMVPIVSRLGEPSKMVLLKYIKGGREGFIMKTDFPIYEGEHYRKEVLDFYD